MKKLHIICGMCGSNEELSYEIDPQGMDIDGVLYPEVYVRCGNCSTSTTLDESIDKNAQGEGS